MLSLAELTDYFKARDINFEIQFFSGEFFALSFEKEFDASSIADLGGTIKIAEVKARFPTETVKEAFLKKNKQAKKGLQFLLFVFWFLFRILCLEFAFWF